MHNMRVLGEHVAPARHRSITGQDAPTAQIAAGDVLIKSLGRSGVHLQSQRSMRFYASHCKTASNAAEPQYVNERSEMGQAHPTYFWHSRSQSNRRLEASRSNSLRSSK